jgi:hypothetical protein
LYDLSKDTQCFLHRAPLAMALPALTGWNTRGDTPAPKRVIRLLSGDDSMSVVPIFTEL